MSKTPINIVFILIGIVQTQSSQLPPHFKILSKEVNQKDNS